MAIHFKRQNLRSHVDVNSYIAFILLIFILTFLSVNTNSEQRIDSSVPFKDENNSLPALASLQKRDILKVNLNKENILTVNGEQLPVDQLKSIAKTFIDNPDNESSLPEKGERNISFFGPMLITMHHLILLSYAPSSTYEQYQQVKHELLGAYHELRDELAEKKWQKTFASLTTEQQKSVIQIYPQQIEETLSVK